MTDAHNQGVTKRSRTSDKLGTAFVILTLLIIGAFEIFKPRFFADDTLNNITTMAITRGLGGIAFICLLIKFGYKVTNPLKKPFLKSLAFCIPAFLVSVNNFPIVGLITGNCRLECETWKVFLLLSECLAIGLFEEFAFRGVVLLTVLEKRHKTTLDMFVSILISSVIFGAVHLLNLLAGAGLGSVLLQIGYSSLIGAMCSVVLIKTHNIWLCVIIHAVFDFGGKLVPDLGIADLIWDPITVTVTVILSLITVAYMTVAFFKIRPETADKIYA